MTPASLPGGDLIIAGLDDLERGEETVAALLVSIGAPRLRRIGFAITQPIPNPEQRLYAMLAASNLQSAHGRFNALVRRLELRTCRRVRALADRARIERFMDALAREARISVRVYLVGGTTAVFMGWRASTVDVDLVMRPEDDALLRAIPTLKETLQVNVKLASPADFIPVPPGWEDRSQFIRDSHRVTFYHFDLYAQALAKVERGHRQDLEDVREMIARSLIDPRRAVEYYARIEPELYRFPAIDPPSFARAAKEAFEK